MNKQKMIAVLIGDEALRLKPYDDATGKTHQPGVPVKGKLTFGIGRNLDDVGITRAEAVYLCGNDIDRVASDLDAHLPWWRSLDEVRQHVLMNMAFNLGIEKLQAFKNTLALIQSGQYEAAARAMLASLWAKQVGDRAKRLATEMETGKEAA